MRLSDWCKKFGSGARLYLAEACGCSRSYVGRVIAGERVPGPELMGRFYLATNGEVEPNDFYDLPKLRRRKRVAA